MTKQIKTIKLLSLISLLLSFEEFLGRFVAKNGPFILKLSHQMTCTLMFVKAVKIKLC